MLSLDFSYEFMKITFGPLPWSEWSSILLKTYHRLLQDLNEFSTASSSDYSENDSSYGPYSINFSPLPIELRKNDASSCSVFNLVTGERFLIPLASSLCVLTTGNN